MSTIAVIGGGQAGGEIAIQLRKLGFDGRVVVIADEPYVPYRRPPLSKAYLAGTVAQESMYLMQPANLDKASIECFTGVKVERIDRKARRLHLSDGNTLEYSKLALATGARARPLPLPGVDRPNVFALRTIGDVNRIREHLQPGKRLVIVGGGFIGLEAAAVTVKLGINVTVLEGLPRVLSRVTVPELSAFYEKVHRDAGVDLRTGVQIASFDGAPTVTEVALSDGTKIPADVVVYGIGVIPNTELAADAGLPVDNGIVVDEYARTSDPDIFAAGDCTNHPNDFVGRRVRLESVQNAMEQARAAARNLLGQNEPYRNVPWFWSDQYDLKLQMVGLSAGHDRMVTRGDPATRSFAVFYLKDGALLAADAVNRPQEFMFSKKLVAERARPDPAKLADESVAMKSFAAAAA